MGFDELPLPSDNDLAVNVGDFNLNLGQEINSALKEYPFRFQFCKVPFGTKFSQQSPHCPANLQLSLIHI